MAGRSKAQLGIDVARLEGDVSKLRSYIHELRAALRSTDARFREQLQRQQYAPGLSDEVTLDNNSEVLDKWGKELK